MNRKTLGKKIRINCWVPIEIHDILDQKRRELKMDHVSDVAEFLIHEAMKSEGWIE